MKISLISYKIASWILVLGGALHSSGDLFAPATPERDELILRMKEITIQLFGATFNAFSFFQGFSFMMGLLLIGYGVLNLLILKNNQQAHLPSNILILNIIICLVGVIISIKYFFIIPILITGIPFLGFLISFLTKLNEAKGK